MDFKVGDTVNVAFTGKIVYINRDGSLEIDIDERESVHYIPAEFVTLADPADWPPRIGDIWATGDNEFFVREHRGQIGRYFLEGAESEPHPSTYSSERLDAFKVLNPRLVRRRDQ